jgi:hypothetical protein
MLVNCRSWRRASHGNFLNLHSRDSISFYASAGMSFSRVGGNFKIRVRRALFDAGKAEGMG